MGQLIGADGQPPRRANTDGLTLDDFLVYCGRCLEELVRPAGRPMYCANGCPP